MSQTYVISWYGKLPSAGDFLKRRFPNVLFNQWSDWFQVGLLNWQNGEEQPSVCQYPCMEFRGAPHVGQPAGADGLPAAG